MAFNFLDFFAKLLVANALLYFVTYFILSFFIEPESVVTEYGLPIVIMIAINSTMKFVYPVAILFTRTKSKSYDFLQSRWHYVAIIITVLSWITAFS